MLEASAAQDEAKMAPSTTKMAPRWPQDAPRRAKMAYENCDFALEVLQKRELKYVTLCYVELS